MYAHGTCADKNKRQLARKLRAAFYLLRKRIMNTTSEYPENVKEKYHTF